jgi:Flp pilus assembly protein TadG
VINNAIAGRERRRLRGRSRRRGRDRGEVVLQTAILFPIIVLILFGCIQVSFYFLARSSAEEAAQMGVDAQRGYQVTGNPGQQAASDFLAQSGGQWLTTNGPPQLSFTGTTVTYTITGRMRSIVPGLNWTVTQSATGPIEQVTG